MKEGIVDDHESGASVIARRAVEVLSRDAIEAGTMTGVRSAADRIAGLRPSMAAIDGALRMFVACLESEPADASSWDRAVRRSRDLTIARMDASRERLVGVAVRLLSGAGPSRLVSLSCSSTVSAILDAWRPPALLLSEGRPGLEGRAMARRYAGRSIPVEMCTDAALPGLLRSGDLVLVGADAVEADGSLVNKVGTLPAAMVARERSVPFFAACERFKFTERTGLPLEEKDVGEVWPDAPSGVALRNLYFERTPGSLVTGFLTDEGIVAFWEGGWRPS